MIQFLREIECIEFECNKFVLVLVKVKTLICTKNDFNIQFVLGQLERILIQKSLSLSDTLDSRGLEEPAHALRGLEEPFSGCAVGVGFGSCGK